MSDIAVRVEGLSKQYTIGVRQERHDTFRDHIASSVGSWFGRNSHRPVSRNGSSTVPAGQVAASDTIWALKDVSFEVNQGEVLGIIGRNGAGKSTLLKILSRITEPTHGRIEIDGRVASLLEVGTGFHPELTGRENIYLNGTIMGMKKKEINRRLDEIVEFAEIEKFLDTPVKHYSSGMYVRLAFGVAAHLEQEILIIDEVLAVGDVAFQKKCLGKMQDVARSGRTVLFVSHNLAVVQGLCSRGIVLSEGQVRFDGAISIAVRQYVDEHANTTARKFIERTDRAGDGRVRFTDFWLEDSNGLRITTVLAGDDIRLCMAYCANGNFSDVHVAINLQQVLGDSLVNPTTSDVGQDLKVDVGTGVIICEVKRFPLRADRYIGNLFCKVNGVLADWVKAAFSIDVENGDFYGTGRLESKGRFLISHSWKVEALEDETGKIPSVQQAGCIEREMK